MFCRGQAIGLAVFMFGTGLLLGSLLPSCLPVWLIAGYDFFAPESFTLVPHETILIPTGIRVMIEDGWVLSLYPRSGLGFRHRLQLDNTVGIIDSDYFEAKNEGHILIKMTSDDHKGKTLSVAAGDGFAQGIFLPFGITVDDEVSAVRNGGFGSTTRA